MVKILHRLRLFTCALSLYLATRYVNYVADIYCQRWDPVTEYDLAVGDNSCKWTVLGIKIGLICLQVLIDAFQYFVIKRYLDDLAFQALLYIEQSVPTIQLDQFNYMTL